MNRVRNGNFVHVLKYHFHNNINKTEHNLRVKRVSVYVFVYKYEIFMNEFI